VSNAFDEGYPRLQRMLLCHRLIVEAAAAPNRGARRDPARGRREDAHGPRRPRGADHAAYLQRSLKGVPRQSLVGLRRKLRRDEWQRRVLTEAARSPTSSRGGTAEENGRSTPTITDIPERADRIAKGALKRHARPAPRPRNQSRRMLHVPRYQAPSRPRPRSNPDLCFVVRNRRTAAVEMPRM
jgi:hypothetical protein